MENPTTFVLSEYSHESCLPCELPQIVTHVKKRYLDVNPKLNVGLKKDISAIPLSKGFFICTKDLVLISNTVGIFRELNGTRSVLELSSNPEKEKALQQLHYYDLLSFGNHKGKVKIAEVAREHVDKYQDDDFVIFSMVPITIELHVTNTCNFQCIHCIKNSTNNCNDDIARGLSIEEMYKIIDECARIGVTKLQFMGGEPLAYANFFRLVQHAKKSGIFYLGTSTNGWLINNKTAKKLAEYFDNIQISIHGASSPVHDGIVRKPGAWEQARRAVALLKNNNVKVNISFTVMRENALDIEEMARLTENWGADSLRFLRLIPQGRGRSLKGWSEKEVFEIGNRIKKIKQDLGSTIELDAGGFGPLLLIKNDAFFYGCDAGKTLMCIESNGGVKACGSLLGNDIGNVREQTILDIWHSQRFFELRRQPDCKDCNYRLICWGPCKVTS